MRRAWAFVHMCAPGPSFICARLGLRSCTLVWLVGACTLVLSLVGSCTLVRSLVGPYAPRPSLRSCTLVHWFIRARTLVRSFMHARSLVCSFRSVVHWVVHTVARDACRNWMVQTLQHVYLLNICRPLNKQAVRTSDGTAKECVAGDEVCRRSLVPPRAAGMAPFCGPTVLRLRPVVPTFRSFGRALTRSCSADLHTHPVAIPLHTNSAQPTPSIPLHPTPSHPIPTMFSPTRFPSVSVRRPMSTRSAKSIWSTPTSRRRASATTTAPSSRSCWAAAASFSTTRAATSAPSAFPSHFPRATQPPTHAPLVRCRASPLIANKSIARARSSSPATRLPAWDRPSSSPKTTRCLGFPAPHTSSPYAWSLLPHPASAFQPAPRPSPLPSPTHGLLPTPFFHPHPTPFFSPLLPSPPHALFPCPPRARLLSPTSAPTRSRGARRRRAPRRTRPRRRCRRRPRARWSTSTRRSATT